MHGLRERRAKSTKFNIHQCTDIKPTTSALLEEVLMMTNRALHKSSSVLSHALPLSDSFEIKCLFLLLLWNVQHKTFMFLQLYW